MKVATVEEMRRMDRHAAESLGITEDILMENAGLAAVAVLRRETEIRGKTIAVLCGTGNNGGDGLVVARQVHSLGGRVRVFICGDPGRYRGAAAANYERARRLGLDLRPWDRATSEGRPFHGADAVVDALFGTGLDREVGGLQRTAIAAVNAAGKPVVSLDIPSGVNGDTGAVMGIAVKAQATVTFGLPKVGNLLYPGFALGGRLYVTHISFPPSLYDDASLRIAVNEPPPLPPRDPEAHKGSVGDCLFIAGAASYFGAPYLAAMSFYKAGGGYARLAAPRSIIGTVAGLGPEIVFHPQEETAAGSIAPQNRESLLDLAGRADMVVIGPGLSLHEETAALVRDLVAAIAKPLLIDGDGLTAVASHREILRGRRHPTVLTPHPGEMARLTGRRKDEIIKDRIGVLREACRDLGAVIVLKGPHSLIGYPDGRVLINLTGNAGMATAGAGDVLTGVIAAMFGQGLPMDAAVAKGVHLHGRAGDLAAAAGGREGITASDIMASLPTALKNGGHNT